MREEEESDWSTVIAFGQLCEWSTVIAFGQLCEWSTVIAFGQLCELTPVNYKPRRYNRFYHLCRL